MAGLVKRALIFVIIAYKKLISPFFRRACRYQPSCSDYSVQAIEKHGALKGAGLSALRVLRCNGYFKGGFDPVK